MGKRYVKGVCFIWACGQSYGPPLPGHFSMGNQVV
jgi:hypothetical protein